jgi:SurA-like N-terminal domain
MTPLPSAERRRRDPASIVKSTKTATPICAGIAFAIVACCIAACGSSKEPPSVPSGAVAVVEDAPDGTISKAEFESALNQTAARQGLTKPPSPSARLYPTLRDAAMSAVLLSRWVRGEAEERGITVSTTEVQRTIKRQFGDQKSFQAFIKQLGLTAQQAREEVELSLITKEIQDQAFADAKGQAGKAVAQEFQTEFIAKWRARTACAPDYVIERCSNGPPSTTTTSTGNATTPPQGVPPNPP